MPRNVRNFWIEVEIDGRTHRLSGGPASAGGGLTATIYMRDDGDVKHALTLRGYTTYGDETKLVLDIEPKVPVIQHKLIGGFRIETDR